MNAASWRERIGCALIIVIGLYAIAPAAPPYSRDPASEGVLSALTDLYNMFTGGVTTGSAGTSQFGLAITTNTTLTVPSGAKCAQISVETASVRYTDDGSSASTSRGHPVSPGQSFQYCGPLSALKFTAVSGSPTLNASYYR